MSKTILHGNDAQVPAKGGTITEGIIGAPLTINPILASTDTERALSELVFAGLMKNTTDGGVVPGIAKEYEVSPDGRTYIFTLLPTKFSNGKALTASDVVFTVSKLQNSAINPTLAAYWSAVTAEAKGNDTVIFTLSENRNDFLSRLTVGILSEKQWAKVPDESFTTHKNNLHPLGAGAFSIKNIRSNNGVIHTIVAVRNNHYVLGAPFIKKLRIEVFSNQQSLLTAVKRNDVDFTTALSSANLSTLSLQKHTITQVPTSSSLALYQLRGDKNALTDSVLLGVVSEFLDRQKIITIVENSYGVPETLETTHLDNLEDAAKKLASLGFKLQNGTLTKNGTALGFSIATYNDPSLVLLANTIATELRPLGITISVRSFDQGFFQTEVANKTFSTLLLKTNTAPSSYEKILPLYQNTIGVVTNEKLKNTPPSFYTSITARYADIAKWYVYTDKLYPFFIKK